MQTLVLDTNVALDLLVFRDPRAASVAAGLRDGALRWIATAGMREELARVLGYPLLAARLAAAGLAADAVLREFDRCTTLVGPAVRAAVTCSDADDQPFIDLAVAHGATLLSKDAAVLALARRLAAVGVTVAACLATPSCSLSQP